MPKLPRITAKQIITVLQKRGFSLIRQSGSHKIFRSADGKRVTVPVHDKKILHPKIIKSILNDLDISERMLKELL